MAVSVDDDPRPREPGTQPRMPIARRTLMTVDHDQAPAGKIDLDALRELAQKSPIRLRPFPRDVVVPEDREDTAESRLQPGEDRGVADVAAVDHQIAGGHQPLDTGVQMAVGIGQDRDPAHRADQPPGRDDGTEEHGLNPWSGPACR